MKRVSLLLLISLVLSSIQQISFAEYWNTERLDIQAPVNMIADSTGQTMYLSYDLRIGLWLSDQEEFTNLNFLLNTEDDVYLHGNFYQGFRDTGGILLETGLHVASIKRYFYKASDQSNWVQIENLPNFAIDRSYFNPQYPLLSVFSTNDSFWISRDGMLTYESYPVLDENLTRFTRFFHYQDELYCIYLFEGSQTINYRICIWDNEAENWDYTNPSFDTNRDMDIEYGIVNSVYELSNGEIAVVIHGGDAGETVHFILFFDEDWQQTASANLEDIYHPVFSQLIEDFENPGYLYGTNNYGLYKSTDFGRNWSFFTHEDLPDSRYSILNIYQQPDSGDLYFSYKENGLFKSTDNGSSWARVDTPPLLGSYEMSLQNEAIGLSQRNYPWVIYQETSWQQYYLPASEDTSYTTWDLFYTNGDTLFGSVIRYTPSNTEFLLAFSSNSGENWDFRPSAILNSVEAFRKENGVRLVSYLMNEEHSPSYSEDFGQQWHQLESSKSRISQAENHFYCYDQDVADVQKAFIPELEWENLNYDGNYIPNDYFPFGDKLLALSDSDRPGGWRDCHWYRNGSWIHTGSFDSYDAIIAAVFEYNGETAVILGSGFYHDHLLISRDLCNTWTPLDLLINEEIPTPTLNNVTYDSDQNRLWVSTDYGLLWAPVEDVLYNSDEPIKLNPVDPKLFTVYPNPFNASTRIHFNLAQPGNVKLDVYDITGRLVKTLQNTYQSAGIQSVYLDGSGLASGTYFIRLNTGMEIRNKKITLVK